MSNDRNFADTVIEATIVTVICVFVFFTVAGLVIGYSARYEKLRREAVEHNAAHYDSITGKWMWNEKKSDEVAK